MNNSEKKKLLNFILICLVFIIMCFTGCSKMEKTKINQMISVDDKHYKIEMDENNNLVIRLPEGRPRVPQLSCDNSNIVQAVFSDGSKEAIARIVSDGKFYSVRFTKEAYLGFELQYDDRYKFIPKTIVANEFYSSNPDVAEVDNVGNVKIIGVSDEGAVITASDGKNKEELVITKTLKAPLNIYLITGQSNASYYYAEPKLATVTKQGTVYHYSELIANNPLSSMNDKEGNMARGNLEAALGKNLYDLTGEKVLLVNAGVSGKKIDTFVPLQGESYKYMDKVWQDINRIIHEKEFQKHYEPRLKSYIWAQGESDKNTAIGSYKNDYMKLHEILTSLDYGLEYGFIIKVRDVYENPSKAQEELANENEDIYISTTSSDFFSVENGKMRFDDLHYSQVGDNVLGEETAKTIVRTYEEGMNFIISNE